MAGSLPFSSSGRVPEIEILHGVYREGYIYLNNDRHFKTAGRPVDNDDDDDDNNDDNDDHHHHMYTTTFVCTP